MRGVGRCMAWNNESRRHSLSRKGIKTAGILDNMQKEVQSISKPTSEKPSSYPEWRTPEQFLPEIQADINQDQETLVQLDYWNRGKTDHGTLNELIERGTRDDLTFQIIDLTSEEYENAIQYGFEIDEDIKWRTDEDKLKKLLKVIRKGKKLNIPYLKYSIHPSFHDHNKTIGDFSQEGHHRSIISDMIGKETIPVLVAYPYNEKYQPLITRYMHPDIRGKVL